ncbi:Platinum sensitivity protein, partial [Spiromyces aspiralis]
LFSCKRKELKLAALRFIRACVGLRNVFYTKYLIRKSILNRVVELFDEVVGRNNLINSACLELFQFILRENLKPLVAHLVKHYAKRYQGLTYTSVFKDLAFLHDQNENEANALQSNAASAFGAGRDGEEEAKAAGGGGVWSNRKVDADEEAYFDAADDEDGLVGDDYAQPSPPIVSPQSENGRVTSGSNSSEDNEDVENKSDKEGSQGRDTATRNPPPLSSPYSSSRSGSESRGSWEPRSGTSRDGGGGLSIRKRESDREGEDDIIQSLVNRSPKKPARHLAFSSGGNYRIGSSGKRQQQQQQQQQQPHPTTPFRVTTAMTASVDSAAKVRAKARPLSLSGGKFIPIKFNRQGLSRSPSPSSCSDDTGSTSSHVGHRDSSSRITPNNRHNDGGNADNHAVNPPATATLHPQQ